MRIPRLLLRAQGAAGLMLVSMAVLAVLIPALCQGAWAGGKGWKASAMPAPEAPAAASAPAVPAARPAEPAVPAVPAAPSKPSAAAAEKALKKANARELFGTAKEPANLAARSVGFYAKGCLAGGQPLPLNGSAWQVMRTSRNRNWGHPSLIRYIARFASDAKVKDGWPGLLVGDLSMPRGGPMPYGHASHQDGLDVDIWYKPAPDRELSDRERETMKMESFLLDPGHVNPQVWKPEYEKLLRRAVSYPEVARIFVNPAIKKWLCDNAKGDRSYLAKVTAIMGHDAHFHVRLSCPANNPGCENQVFKADEGCGKGLDKWIVNLMKPKPNTLATKFAALRGKLAASRGSSAGVKKPAFPMGQLPLECVAVLKAEPAKMPPAMAAQ